VDVRGSVPYPPHPCDLKCRLRGGVEAEREERCLIREEEEARRRANFEGMLRLRQEGARLVGNMIQL